MDLTKTIESQTLTAEEVDRLSDWVARLRDGRVVTRIPSVIFGVPVTEQNAGFVLSALQTKVEALKKG